LIQFANLSLKFFDFFSSDLPFISFNSYLWDLNRIFMILTTQFLIKLLLIIFLVSFKN